MQLTDYHATYYAHELTKRCSSDSIEKLAASLADAQVDLNPHSEDRIKEDSQVGREAEGAEGDQVAGEEAQHQTPHTF